jgi:hypothetical protein
VGFLVDEVAPGQVSLQTFQFSLAILLLPMLHAALSFIFVLLMLYNVRSPLHLEVTHLMVKEPYKLFEPKRSQSQIMSDKQVHPPDDTEGCVFFTHVITVVFRC